jgi:Fe-S cluster assembly protein SufB
LTPRRRWEDLPLAVRRTFEQLGVPQAERRYFAGSGAQLESLTAYHRLKERWRREGIIFEDFDTAVQQYPALIKRYFMTECVRPQEHKFAALHAAVFSGGTFIYVPPRRKVTLPLQAYFRMFAPATGQFEHTLIIADKAAEVTYLEACSAPRYNKANLHAGCVEIFVRPHAKVRYISVENWSANTYNLNTKRALVDTDGYLEFINGNFGAGTTMLYPSVILRGPRARTRVLGVALAGKGQRQDTGAKVFHYAAQTQATVFSRNVVGPGGHSTYRGHVYIAAGAREARVAVSCEALLLGQSAAAQTLPSFDVRAPAAEVAHEASVGRLGEEQIFYLRTRGFTETEAVEALILGFFGPLVRRLPLEYAVEFRRLLNLELIHKAA